MRSRARPGTSACTTYDITEIPPHITDDDFIKYVFKGLISDNAKSQPKSADQPRAYSNPHYNIFSSLAAKAFGRKKENNYVQNQV